MELGYGYTLDTPAGTRFAESILIFVDLLLTVWRFVLVKEHVCHDHAIQGLDRINKMANTTFCVAFTIQIHVLLLKYHILYSY